jgi:hypothetical protein
MIGFSLRLAVAGGREAITRLVVIAAAVAIGVAMLATTVAGVNAVTAQTARYEWLTPPDTGGPLLWEARNDYYHGEGLGRIDVAVTGPGAPVPPGLARLPGPGEYFVSPAMQRLLRTAPADQFGDRFPGHEVGLIGHAALPAPDSLAIVVGHRPDELAKAPDVRKVSAFNSTTSIGLSAAGFDLVLAVVAAGLLFPILMLIGTATRLSAARREERFAAMRLIGATPRQITLIATVEAAVSATVGTAVGFALFYALRSTFARIPFTGRRFFTSDLSLGFLGAAAVAIGIPVAAALVARLALRRVNISPLGVTRRVTPKPPGAWRLIPVAIGLAELAYFIPVERRPHTSLGQVAAFLPGCLITMAGLVIAGPWLTMVASRVLARRAGRPAALIAARRLADNPKAAFRAVSGLILALFVASVAVGIITTIVDHRGAPTTGGAATNVRQVEPPPGPIPAGLSSIPGVQKVVTVFQAPEPRPAISGGSLPGWTPDGLVRCADIAGRPDFGRCEPGAQVAAVFDNLVGPTDKVKDIVWPTAEIDPDQLGALQPYSLVVGTDGSADAIERARTVLITAYPNSDLLPGTEAEWDADFARTLTGWKQLANVIIVSSMVLAGCSLAVSVVGGLTDRKRPFSMLRLTGVQLGALRRVVALETAVPLLSAAVVAVAVGFFTAHLFLLAQMHYSLRPPGPSYLLIVAAGLLVSLGIVASTFPLLRRVTGPETARNE